MPTIGEKKRAYLHFSLLSGQCDVKNIQGLLWLLRIEIQNTLIRVFNSFLLLHAGIHQLLNVHYQSHWEKNMLPEPRRDSEKDHI